MMDKEMEKVTAVLPQVRKRETSPHLGWSTSMNNEKNVLVDVNSIFLTYLMRIIALIVNIFAKKKKGP